MAILIDERTRVLVQGITGHQGSFHTGQMIEYGTRVVAGVSPGKEGQEVHGVPVYDTVEAAVEKHGATASIVFVPAPFTKDAVLEALDAGIKLVVVITEHVPLHDAMEIMARARLKGATIVGPNTFGVISPGKCKIGIMPNHIYTPGRVGIVARSGTLSYEIAASLSQAGFGQSTVVGMGGDRVVGLSFIDVLKMME
ncbi:MAG: succinate--CoA ligase subunit alpha, partial [Bacillota bacterium]